MTDTNDFISVRRRRKYGRRSSSKAVQITGKHAERDDGDEVDRERLLRTLDNTRVEVRDTSFTEFVLGRLTESLTALNSTGITEIVCYGLGRFSQYRSPRCQLAFLLCLKARYDGARVYVYDPVFCPEEVRALRALDLEIIECNEEGKRIVRDGTTTLVYMPHCSRQLMNNFLYANWGDGLCNCILLANSFSGILDSCLRRDILDTASYILRIQPYVTEIQLDNTFVYEEVFSDLNIHIFTKENLLNVPSDFWSSREEPRYSNQDLEFITACDV